MNLKDTRSDHHFLGKTLNVLDNLVGESKQRGLALEDPRSAKEGGNVRALIASTATVLLWIACLCTSVMKLCRRSSGIRERSGLTLQSFA